MASVIVGSIRGSGLVGCIPTYLEIEGGGVERLLKEAWAWIWGGRSCLLFEGGGRLH